MKKILLILSLLFIFTSAILAQDNEYYYKIKLQGVTDITSANNITELLENIFKNKTPFNDSTCCFEFQSKMCVNPTGFYYVMRDESYVVLLFDKQEIVMTKKEE